jgi:phenylalanyl-tRNA synthetase beta chain
MDRDLSLLVPAALKYDKIKEVIKKSGTSLLKDMFIFDVYQGEQVKQGFKSYSLRLEFEDKNETLEDKKVDKIISKIMENLEKELEVSIRI